MPGRAGAVLRPGGNEPCSVASPVLVRGTESGRVRSGIVGDVFGVPPCAAARLSAEMPALALVVASLGLVEGAVDAREPLVAEAGVPEEAGAAVVPVVPEVAAADPLPAVDELAAAPAPLPPEPPPPAPCAKSEPRQALLQIPAMRRKGFEFMTSQELMIVLSTQGPEAGERGVQPFDRPMQKTFVPDGESASVAR